MSSDWPLPEYNREIEPHFLFLLTPPNSGSTAMVKIINTSHRAMILRGNGEGQWLVPGLSEKDRWEAGKVVDYQSVKAVWLNRFQEVRVLVQNVDVVIEKSPPNLMRIDELMATFQDTSVLANNRDPYATSGSILYRYNDADSLSQGERLAILRRFITKWIMISRAIRALVLGKGVPLITYESFCENPRRLLAKLDLPEGVAGTIDFDAAVKVKDYEPQKISDQNQRQIANLRREEIEYLSSCLNGEEELLSFFGYQIP